jgi:uncharacterized protein (DUF983 family)
MPHQREIETESGLALPSLGRALRLFGRAFIVHCPHCGRGPVLEHWLRLRVKCGTCGLRMQRGEHDSFTGSMFILFGLVGISAYLAIVLAMTTTDETPWGLLQYGLPLLTIALVVFYFPIAKLSWLALDLLLRPVTPDELTWHRDADTEFEIDRRR